MFEKVEQTKQVRCNSNRISLVYVIEKLGDTRISSTYF